MTAIISPEGAHVVPPLTESEGILVADLDMDLIAKRKRMMDSVGHYARPELLSLVLDNRPQAPMRAAAEPASLSFGDESDDADAADRDGHSGTDQRVAVLRRTPR